MQRRPTTVSKCLVDFPTVSSVQEVEITYNTNGGMSHMPTMVSGIGLFKACGFCRQVKPLSDYHKDKSSFNGVTTRCRECACKRSRQCHAERMLDDDWLDKRRAIGRNAGRERKRKAVKYKGGACHDCKKVYPDYVYDFHHLDGDTKTDNPSAILKRTWEGAVEELDLCVMVCANCHRERHFGET